MLRRGAVRRRTGGRWVRLRYRWRGYLDGRMDLPAVPETKAHATPTLERLAQQVRREQDALQTRLVELTAADAISLAPLQGPGGERERAEERLAEMERRLAEMRRHGPAAHRRLGEQHLPEELIQSRRRREFERKERTARKRVEDEKTRLSDVVQRIHELKERILAARREAEAQARLVGEAQQTLATHYFNGVIRTHSEPEVVTERLRELSPVSRSGLTNAGGMQA